MSKKTENGPRKGPFKMLESGVIKIARPIENPLAPYVAAEKDEIPDYLAAVDHTVSIPKKKDYEKQMNAEEERFNKLVRRMALARKYLSWCCKVAMVPVRAVPPSALPAPSTSTPSSS